jgi:hypothetical protein
VSLEGCASRSSRCSAHAGELKEREGESKKRGKEVATDTQETSVTRLTEENHVHLLTDAVRKKHRGQGNTVMLVMCYELCLGLAEGITCIY